MDPLGRFLLARMSGAIDRSNAAAFSAKVRDAISNDALGMVVDLEHVDYLDSSGAELLFDLHRRLHERNQALCLVAPSGSPARRLLQLLAADQMLRLAETVDAAQAAFEGDEITPR